MFFFSYSQLFYDGYKDLAVGLAAIIQPHPACPPSDRLLKIVKLGLKYDDEGNLFLFCSNVKIPNVIINFNYSIRL